MAIGPERWPDVERLFHAACALPVAARPAFLAEHCGNDPELQQEIESLLARADSTDVLLDGPRSPTATALTAVRGPVLTGRRIGVYEVLEQIGAGAMGEVYRARDTTLDRDVAIKVLPHEFSDDPQRLARFAREARLLAALNHPNIATIHGIASAEGVHAIILELIEGDTLAERLAHGPLPAREALSIARQVADALDAAHTQDIVHRDLKPGNIKITPRGTVKVLDFGLAKVAADRGRNAASGMQTIASTATVGATRAGAILGTAAYMSPEQARGDAVDPRTDVWAFGCVLFETLSARSPFDARTLWDCLAAVLRQDPPWDALPRSTPAAVHVLLRQCLDKNANERPNMSAVRAQIDAALAPRPVWTKTAALLVFVGIAWFGIRYAPSLMSILRSPNQAVSQANASNLAQQAAALLERDDKVENVDLAVTLLEQALAQDTESALAYAYLADAYVRRHQVSPDSEWLRRARDAAQHAVALNGDLGVAHIALGRAQLEAGEDEQAINSFTRAIELDPLNPRPHVGLATAFADQSQDAKAETEFRLATTRGGRLWRTHLGYGLFLFQRGRYAEAAREWETAGTVAPGNVVVYRTLGAAYYQLGRYDEAASAFQRALEIQPSAPTYTNLGTLRFFEGRYVEAVAAFEKAVELGANTYLNWGNLGDGLRWAPGRRPDATAPYRRAIDLIEKQIVQKPQDADLITRRAVYLMKLGDRTRAVKEAGEIATRPMLAPPVLYRLTTVYELAGDRARALTLLEQALRGGYPAREIDNDPELTALRADARYHRLIDGLIQSPR
jgi:serine/threonine protein kinase/Flp pilus assembly protein TadD